MHPRSSFGHQLVRVPTMTRVDCQSRIFWLLRLILLSEQRFSRKPGWTRASWHFAQRPKCSPGRSKRHLDISPSTLSSPMFLSSIALYKFTLRIRMLLPEEKIPKLLVIVNTRGKWGGAKQCHPAMALPGGPMQYLTTAGQSLNWMAFQAIAKYAGTVFLGKVNGLLTQYRFSQSFSLEKAERWLWVKEENMKKPAWSPPNHSSNTLQCETIKQISILVTKRSCLLKQQKLSHLTMQENVNPKCSAFQETEPTN